MNNSAYRTGKNYYLQVFLVECEYVIKEKKIHNYVIDNVKISTDSDEETLLEKIIIKLTLLKLIF